MAWWDERNEPWFIPTTFVVAILALAEVWVLWELYQILAR
jgi:hypothetical protein